MWPVGELAGHIHALACSKLPRNFEPAVASAEVTISATKADTLMAASELEYEPNATARAVMVERAGGDSVTRIVVAMPGLYAPVPKWIGDLHAFAIVVAPLWWITEALVRKLLHVPSPPRAVFEISGDRFRLRMRDPLSGEVTASDWPRSAVAEARASRYDNGLWLNVTGFVKATYLTDLPRETVERLETALRAVLAGDAHAS